MPNEVTDPAMLEQLEAGSGQQVTDPALLERLNREPSEDHDSPMTSLRKEVHRGIAKADRDYLLPLLGVPADIAGWAADVDDIPFGREWLAEHLGVKDIPEPKTTVGRMASEAAGAAATAPLTGGVLGKGVEAAGAGLEALGGYAGKSVFDTAGKAMGKVGQELGNVGSNIKSAVGSAVGGEGLAAPFKGTPLEPWMHKAGELIGAYGGGLHDAPPHTTRTKTDDILDAYERLGLNPSFAEAEVGGRTAALAQGNVLPQMAGSAGVIHEAAKSNFEKFVTAQQEVAQKFGKPAIDKYAAGADLQKAITTNWQTAKNTAGAGIERAEKSFGPSEMIYAQNFINAVSNPVGAATSASVRKATIDPLVEEAKKIIRDNGGHLTFRDMKALSAKYGNALDRTFAMGTDDAQVAQLRKALRKDMDDAIKSKGADVYNNYKLSQVAYARSMANYRQAFKKLIGTKDVPIRAEAVYDIIRGSATQQGRADMRLFTKVWDSLDKGKRGDLAAYTLSRMGVKDEKQVGNLEGWSLGNFLTQYRGLSDEGKQLLFDTTGNAKIRQALDDLVLTASQLQHVQKLASTSKSGGAAAMLGQVSAATGTGFALGGAPGAVAGFLTGLTGPYAMAQFLTSPTAVKTVTKALKDFDEGTKGIARAAVTLNSFGRGVQPGAQQ